MEKQKKSFKVVAFFTVVAVASILIAFSYNGSKNIDKILDEKDELDDIEDI